MPIVSENQRKAMHAAAEGRSTLGIPKAVAKKFLSHDFQAVLGANSAIPAGVSDRLRKRAYDSAINSATEHAAGLLFVAPDGDVLLLRRSPKEENFPGYWSMPGGGVDEGETPEQGAIREAREEMGVDADPAALRDIEKTITPKGKAFHTFALAVPEKFVPKLNDEHNGYAWASLDMLPRPMHPAIEQMMKDRLGVTADMTPEDWTGLRDGLLKWLAEEQREPEHALDQMFAKDDWNESAHPRAPDGTFGNGGSTGPNHHIIREKGDVRAKPSEKEARMLGLIGKPKPEERKAHEGKKPISAEDLEKKLRGMPTEKLQAAASNKEVDPMIRVRVKRLFTGRLMGATDSALRIALDAESVREKRKDGQLVVKVANISKANVCPYRGSEIPGWEQLGLERDRIYNLLRDPEELKKAAPTLNGVQLLHKHVAVNADDHRPYDTVGSLGTDADFDGEYLKNSLFVNAKSAIDGIESGAKRELSAGYHYKPDMTPGNFRGTRYDGVMRDIVFNHVALVEDGRAGPDVVIGDSRENVMKPTRFAAVILAATASHIAPLLAMDSKVQINSSAFKGLSPKNYKDQRATFLSGVRAAVDGKLRPGIALDATMEDLAKAVDAFTGLEEEVEDADEPKLEELASIAPEPPVEPTAPDKTTYDAEPLKAFLREKGMDEESIMKACDMLPKPGITGDEDDDDEKDKESPAMDSKNFVSKQAFDQALKVQGDDFAKRIAGVRETERGIRAAIAEVKPWVGELSPALAFDSAADVHRHALKMLGVEGADKLHADALLPILKSRQLPGARPSQIDSTSIAMDASAIDKATKHAPGLANIQTVA